MNELEQNFEILSIFSHLEYLDSLPHACSATGEMGFGFKSLDLGRQLMGQLVPSENLLAFYTQLPFEGASLKLVWWFDKDSIDNDVVKNAKNGVLDLVPLGVFFETYQYPGANENERNIKAIERAIGSLLFLTRNKSVKSLLELDPREWEAFVRRKNSEPMVEFLQAQAAFNEKNLTQLELHKCLRGFKWQLLVELGARFCQYHDDLRGEQPFVQAFLSDNYERQNRTFFHWEHLLCAFFGESNMPFRVVEVQKIEARWQYLVVKKAGLSVEKDFFFQRMLSEKSINSHFIPINLVAVE